jgi:hypothetical protein
MVVVTVMMMMIMMTVAMGLRTIEGNIKQILQ